MRSDWVQCYTWKLFCVEFSGNFFYWIVKKVQNFNVRCRVTPTFKNVCTERLANFGSFYLFVRFSRFLLWYYTDFISLSEKGWVWVCWYCYFGRNNSAKIWPIWAKSAKKKFLSFKNLAPDYSTYRTFSIRFRWNFLLEFSATHFPFLAWVGGKRGS